jgi:hypothetical protein
MEDRRVRISQELVKLGAVPTTPQKISRKGEEHNSNLRTRKKIFSGSELSEPQAQLRRV